LIGEFDVWIELVVLEELEENRRKKNKQRGAVTDPGGRKEESVL
jgi:hypothetical protein